MLGAGRKWVEAEVGEVGQWVSQVEGPLGTGHLVLPNCPSTLPLQFWSCLVDTLLPAFPLYSLSLICMLRNQKQDSSKHHGPTMDIPVGPRQQGTPEMAPIPLNRSSRKEETHLCYLQTRQCTPIMWPLERPKNTLKKQ